MSEKPIDYLQIAAQCWCHPSVSDREMDIALAKVFAERLIEVVGKERTNLAAERDRYKSALEKIAKQPWDSVDDDSIKWAREALAPETK